MNCQRVQIRELACWGFDDYEYRPNSYDLCKKSEACRVIVQRPPFRLTSAFLEAETAALRDLLAIQALRPDLHAEMSGLDWSIGVVDLRLLLAFQRRLAFDQRFLQIPAPATDNWDALTALSFGPRKPLICDFIHDRTTVVLRSSNPNMHFRVSTDTSSPVTIHAGSSFFEVAQYRGRWFLRDGYHRAYTLLRAGIFQLPAVIVQAMTLEELGASQPWFFPEEVLFSSSPPLVTDFLDDRLVLEYDRPPLIKTLRVTVEETLTPAKSSGENS